MQRLLNAPENYVDEMLDGIYAAHPELVTYTADDKRCLVSRYKKPGKVGIATGGGSGHLPLFLGYVGEGMADGCITVNEGGDLVLVPPVSVTVNTRSPPSLTVAASPMLTVSVGATSVIVPVPVPVPTV